ncbi:MAG: DNA recombination protein RmuC [Bacteroidota bacterium]|jgi:DNA recombination protein RmuC
MDSIVFLVAGMLSGALIVFFYFKSKSNGESIPKSDYLELDQRFRELELAHAKSISVDKVQNEYVSKELYESLKSSSDRNTSELDLLKSEYSKQQQQIVHLTGATMDRQEVEAKFILRTAYQEILNKLQERESLLKEKEETVIQLSKQLTSALEKEIHLNEKIGLFNQELENLRQQSQQMFRNLAGEILEEKKKLFVDENKKELGTIMDPLKTQLNDFREKIESTRREDIKDLTTLKGEIESLQKLNTQLSEDARKLATALKADVKMQGNWGEDRLHMILQSEGLERYIDYNREAHVYDDEQERNRRPDFVLNLPEGRCLVIDSKVSLTAYVEYHNADTQEKRQAALQAHIKSVTDHIEKLGDKNYHALANMKTPDYVFMFMPVESALTLVLNENPDVFNKALNRKIVLITPNNLVATLKVIKLLWQKENQIKNVDEIFRQCGALYDKFVAFLEQMNKMSEGLDTARSAYKAAMDHLSTGSKKGSTIIGRFENIRQLEAKANKKMPPNFLNEISLLPDDIIDGEAQDLTESSPQDS